MQLAGLSIRSLKVLDAVMLSGKLSAAAAMLHLSQSAASRQLLELENAVGLTLFHRSNRQLRPTNTGLRFHAETQHILTGIAEIPAIVDTIKAEMLSVIAMPRLSAISAA